MAKDLFGAPRINGHHYLPPIDEFRWVVAVCQADGATQVIKRARENELQTFYPIRRTFKGEYSPLWKNYLFVQWREFITLEVCRSTTKFMTFINTHDEEGIVKPVLVRRNAIDETLRMITQGKYDERLIDRRFYGKGSIVRVIEGNFMDRNVRLEEAILPEMHGNHKVAVDLNGIKAVIEIYKLAL
jgi:transcription antitermination factor NusG